MGIRANCPMADQADAARAEADQKMENTTNKATDGCEKNCGSCGVRIAKCKRSMDEKIKGLSFSKFRLGLRGCNMLMALLVIFCVILGYATLGVDSYSTFVLSLFLLIGGLVLAGLEMTCCCVGLEGKLRRTFPFVFYARGRSWLIVMFAFLGFGLGLVPILVGVFCLLPYGLFSRYMIAIHPECGDRMVTTISADEIAQIKAQGLSIYDHYTILDVKAETELMSSSGIVRLTAELHETTKTQALTAPDAQFAVTPVQPVAAPSHQDPPASVNDDPFSSSQDPDVRQSIHAPDPITPLAPPVTNAFGQAEDRV